MAAIVQTVGNFTSVATPASIVGTYAATGVGSLLVAVVAVAPSAAPAVATPASWTAGPSVSSVNLGIFTFYFPNNPSAITTVTFTLTNANGACVTMYEVSGVQAVTPLDTSNASAIASSTTVGTATTSPLLDNEFALGASAWIAAAALTSITVPPSGIWTAAALQTSNTGATNVVLQAYRALPGTLRPLSVGGTLAPAQQNASILLTFVSASAPPSAALPELTVAGAQSQMASGVGFPGSIGGQ